MSHAGQENDLTARSGVGGVGHRLQEREQKRLRGLDAKRKCATADIGQTEIGQSGHGPGYRRGYGIGTAQSGQDDD